MSAKWRNIGIVIVVLLMIGLIAIPKLAFEREKSRRRHQIGQLWLLIRLYYAPAHEGFYPTDLAQLKTLPNYVPFFDRALREIDLTAPGIKGDSVNPKTVALREHTADSHGGRWEHEVDGSISYLPVKMGATP